MGNQKNKLIAEKVVDRIIETINDGKPLPWVKPWGSKSHTVRVLNGQKEITIYPSAWARNGKEYKGANTYLPTGEYITWNQAKKENKDAHLKKGSKSWPVVYWNFIEKEEQDPDDPDKTVKVTIPVLKYYLVFNVNDWEGITQKHHPVPHTVTVPVYKTQTVENVTAGNADADAIVADYISRAGNGFHVLADKESDSAYYNRELDYVRVPMIDQFEKANEYYSTLFHELGHSTGHKTRLDRFSGKNRIAAWGDENYSREELVAESTAATILNALGLEDANTFRNSAAYIKNWSDAIKADPMMYVTAATRAQAAVDMILGLEKDPAPTSPDGDGEPTDPEAPEKAPEAPVEPSEPVAAPVPAEKPAKARKTAKADVVAKWNERALKELDRLHARWEKKRLSRPAIAYYQKNSALSTEREDAFLFTPFDEAAYMFKIYGQVQRASWAGATKHSELSKIEQQAERNAKLAETAKQGTAKGRDVVVMTAGDRTVVFNKKVVNKFPKNALFYLNGAKEPAVVMLENGSQFVTIGLILPVSTDPAKVQYAE